VSFGFIAIEFCEDPVLVHRQPWLISGQNILDFLTVITPDYGRCCRLTHIIPPLTKASYGHFLQKYLFLVPMDYPTITVLYLNKGGEYWTRTRDLLHAKRIVPYLNTYR